MSGLGKFCRLSIAIVPVVDNSLLSPRFAKANTFDVLTKLLRSLISARAYGITPSCPVTSISGRLTDHGRGRLLTVLRVSLLALIPIISVINDRFLLLWFAEA